MDEHTHHNHRFGSVHNWWAYQSNREYGSPDIDESASSTYPCTSDGAMDQLVNKQLCSREQFSSSSKASLVYKLPTLKNNSSLAAGQ
jgi:hypothetical protein